MSLPAENTGDYRVSIWSIHEESHARFVTVCAAASLTAIVLCLGFWNWNEWDLAASVPARQGNQRCGRLVRSGHLGSFQRS